MNNNSNRDYATENINLKQQIIDLKVANKDKAETIKAMKQELLEYNQLRDRFKVLYEENEKRKNAIEVIKNKKVDMRYFLECVGVYTYNFWATKEGAASLTQQEYNLLEEELKNEN